ncbi:MAG: hypothetical protein ACI4SJ_00510 [Candidatus Avispirillum sp.]
MVDYSVYLDVSRQDCQFVLTGPRKGENNARRLIILPMAGMKTMDLSGIAAVHFHLRAPSGTEYSSECSVENGCIVHTLTGGESAEEGEALCEVRFQDAEGTVLFSPQFRTVFSDSMFDSAAAPSEETTEWTQLIGRVAELEGGKVDKVEGATEGNLAVFDGEGGIKDGGAAVNIYTLKYAEPDADPGYWTSATNPELFAALDSIKNDIAAGKKIAVLMDVNPSSGYNQVINASAYLSGSSIEVRGRFDYSGIYRTYSISRIRNADKVYLSKSYTYEDDIDNIGSVANAPTVDLMAKLLGNKQDALTAGDNIEIEDNVIKATVEKGDKGEKGEKGDSGVYVGAGDMPEGYNVQIDPDGEAPDGYIPTPSTAEVGQTIVVKSVDENGKPTEWETADIPTNATGETWETIADITTEEEVTSLTINTDLNGDPFELVEAEAFISIAYTDSNTSDAALTIRTNKNSAALGGTNSVATRMFRAGTGSSLLGIKFSCRAGAIFGTLYNVGNVISNIYGYFNSNFSTLNALYLYGGTFGVGSHIVIRGIRA